MKLLNLTQDEQKALENLRGYDDIIIKQADKGSAVVVMDREAYINEAMGQLDDSEVYISMRRFARVGRRGILTKKQRII